MLIVGSAVEQNRRDKQEFSFGFYAIGGQQLRTEKIKKNMADGRAKRKIK